MAKVWFYNIPFHGHVNPTLPLVRELVRRGDKLTYYSTDSFKERIRATGAECRAYGSSHAFQSTRSVTHVIHLGSQIAEATRALLPEVLAAAGEEPPDYLMFDMSAPWGKIASRQLNIPAVASFPHLPFYWRTVLNDMRVFRKGIQSVRPGYGYWRRLRQQTARIVKEFNLRNPRDFNILSSSAERNIVFSSRYFQPYERHFDESYLYVGPEIERERGERPLVLSKSPEQKVVYVAVGTVYQANSEFFRLCMQAFASERYQVVMSVGRAVHPADLGTIPSNFMVEQYVPQLSVLEQTDLFLTHGGMNSISESVVYGVPMIVVPNTIEQAINAVRVEQLEAGLYLNPARLTAEKLLRAAEAVLDNGSYAVGIGRIAESFRASGGVARAADAIQEFKQAHNLS